MKVNQVNSMDLDDPRIIEGFPGSGLVAKIAVDHLIGRLDMDLYAEIHSADTPNAAMFEGDDYRIAAPVRIYGSEEENLLVITSDTPISANNDEFLDGLVKWIQEQELAPVFLVGIPRGGDEKEIFGASTGGASMPLEELGISPPPATGMIVGPTGGLLEKTSRHQFPSQLIAVTCQRDFPDPLAAKKLIDEGVAPLTGVELDTSQLQEASEEIKEKKKQIAQKLKEAKQTEKSEAYPMEMYG